MKYAWIKAFSYGYTNWICTPYKEGLILGDVVEFKLVNGKTVIGIIKEISHTRGENLGEIVAVFRKETI